MEHCFEIVAKGCYVLTDTPAHRTIVEGILLASIYALEKAVEAFTLIYHLHVRSSCLKVSVGPFLTLCRFHQLEDCCKYRHYILEADDRKTCILC